MTTDPVTLTEEATELRPPKSGRWLRVGLVGFVVAGVLGGGVALLSGYDHPTGAVADGDAHLSEEALVAEVVVADDLEPTTTTTWGPPVPTSVEIAPPATEVPRTVSTPARDPDPVEPPVVDDLPDGQVRGEDGNTYGMIDSNSGPGTDLRTLTPDYIAIINPDGTVAGYARAVDLYPTVDEPSLLDTPEGVPVYAADGTTVVGHITREKGYLPIGVNPDDVPPVGVDPSDPPAK